MTANSRQRKRYRNDAKSRRKVYDSFFVHRNIPIKVITVHPNHPNPPLCKSMLHAYATSLSSALVTPLLTHHWEPVYQVSKVCFCPGRKRRCLIIRPWYHPLVLCSGLVFVLFPPRFIGSTSRCSPPSPRSSFGSRSLRSIHMHRRRQ